MNYLAFDLGTKCGYAMFVNGEISYGLIDLSEDGKFADRAYCVFTTKLVNLLENTEFEKVFIEKPHAGKYFHATKILFGLMGILELYCQFNWTSYEHYSPATIKKYWAGSGRASKKEMVAVTRERFPEVKDHNVSDSLALLHYGMEQNDSTN